MTDSIFWLRVPDHRLKPLQEKFSAEDAQRKGDLVVDIAQTDRIELSLPDGLHLAGCTHNADFIKTVTPGHLLDQAEVRADVVARSGGGKKFGLCGRDNRLRLPGRAARARNDGTIDDALFERVGKERGYDSAVLGMLQDLLIDRPRRDH